MKKLIVALVVLIIIAAAGFYVFRGEEATVPIAQGYGPQPTLPQPNPTTIPTVNVAEASSWPAGMTPTAAEGLAVKAFAEDLDHPRMLHVLPNGDVLVAESNAPAPHDDTGFSIRNYVQGLLMSKAGATVPSPDKIVLLRDADGDGVAEVKSTYLSGLHSPFGMALVGTTLYVANTDAIVAFPYVEGANEITDKGNKIVDLPAGKINHHWTKDLVASKDGSKLYVTVGSNSNVGENGMDAEEGRAAVQEVDLATKQMRIFATGIRNPNGISWNPESGALWVAVNERDEIGSDLVPDYMTSVQDGGFYGWPYSYYGQHIDTRPQPPRPDLVAKALVPDYALGPHTASLGLTFDTGALLPAEYKNGAFVGQHGSWNRKPHSGYKVIFVPFTAGKPSGQPKDILTGFLDEGKNIAMGRPVGVAIDKAGALLVADDVGNKVWRVTPASGATSSVK